MKYAITVISIFFHITPVLAQDNTADARPNVILILADDMGIGDLSAINGGMNRTPVLDALMEESVWCDQAYSASAVCAPARAGLLTGRYPHRTGVVSLNMENFPTLTSLGRGEVTMADLFRGNGYHTGLIGKWHLGTRPEYRPMERGFQEFAGFMYPDVKTYYKYRLDINGTYRDYDGPYLTDVLTEHAIDYVNEHQDEPFFLHLAYYVPHRPLGAPEDMIAYYQEQGYDLKTAKVYAMIEVMDRGIGALLDELDKLGIRENTLVIFASDNGPDPLTGERFNQHLKGRKYSVYEGGIRVPLIFNWKGHLASRKVDRLAHFTDVLPTLVDLCNLDIGEDVTKKLDGGSLSNVLSGQPGTELPEARYWQWNRGVPYYSHNAAMREGDWKLVRPMVTRDVVENDSGLKPLLFNLKQDSMESKDISEDYPKVYERMKVMLEDWSRKMEFERLNNNR